MKKNCESLKYQQAGPILNWKMFMEYLDLI